MNAALLVPVGSAGDVLPFLGIGRALKRRGLGVAVLANRYFEDAVRRADLDFLALGSREEFLELLAVRRPVAVARAARQVAHDTTVRLCDAVLANASPRTVLLTHTLAFGARIAAEKLGLRSVTAHLAPAALDRDPVLPGFFNSERRPAWYRRGVRWFYDRLADAIWSAPANRLRRAHGLAPERPSRIGRTPSCLGLFPGWFAPAKPDWPEGTVLTGFSLYDDPGSAEAPSDLARFLDEGPAPVVFTPGTGSVDERRFFEVAIRAADRLGRRALLLTRFRAQLPEALPEHARHAAYVPLGALLPRAAAIVHHGGIGTCAQALRSGTPQLIVPARFDQLDNAARVHRLGAGASIPRRRLHPGVVERSLRSLLDSAVVRQRCELASRRIAGWSAEEIACDAIIPRSAPMA